MSESNADEPAFPSVITERDQFGKLHYLNGDGPGLTKREYFAGLAMQGMLANPDKDYDPPYLARDCRVIADALLAELAKEPTYAKEN